MARAIPSGVILSKPEIHRSSGACGRVTIGLGPAFEVHEWTGGGPGYMHVHYADDEMWHVISGRLRFRFDDGDVEAGPGTTVHVPAGVAHDYEEISQSRYLIVMPPRLRKLIEELHVTPYDRHGVVMKKYRSAIVE